MNCPQCHAPMTEGFVTAREGIFFFRHTPQLELDLFAEALPATSAYMRRAMLEAYRCVGCEFVLIRYGKQVGDPKRFEHK